MPFNCFSYTKFNQAPKCVLKISQQTRNRTDITTIRFFVIILYSAIFPNMICVGFFSENILLIF